jgi:hypothetical protein
MYKQGEATKKSIDHMEIQQPHVGANPDKGFAGNHSGTMGMETGEYGMGHKYRGNEYNKLEENLVKKDSGKISKSKKSYGQS